jgi:hypothetical protein
MRLSGDVYGHPNFPEGHWVITSPLVGDQTEFEEDQNAETLNSIYVLGTPLK